MNDKGQSVHGKKCHRQHHRNRASDRTSHSSVHAWGQTILQREGHSAGQHAAPPTEHSNRKGASRAFAATSATKKSRPSMTNGRQLPRRTPPNVAPLHTSLRALGKCAPCVAEQRASATRWSCRLRFWVSQRCVNRQLCRRERETVGNNFQSSAIQCGGPRTHFDSNPGSCTLQRATPRPHSTRGPKVATREWTATSALACGQREGKVESAQEDHAEGLRVKKRESVRGKGKNGMVDRGLVWDLIRARSCPDRAGQNSPEKNLLSTAPAAFFCRPRRGGWVQTHCHTCTSSEFVSKWRIQPCHPHFALTRQNCMHSGQPTLMSGESSNPPTDVRVTLLHHWQAICPVAPMG